jgi:hypothetical protein
LQEAKNKTWPDAEQPSGRGQLPPTTPQWATKPACPLSTMSSTSYAPLPTSPARSRSTSPGTLTHRRSTSSASDNDEKDWEKRELLQRDLDDAHAALEADPRFHTPTPAPWKRVGLLVFMAILFWIALRMRAPQPEQPKIVHANRYVAHTCTPRSACLFSGRPPLYPDTRFSLCSDPLIPILFSWNAGLKLMFAITFRYSKEFKFRPAASPVITERLKDGRVRLRGAQPTL